VGSIPSTLGYLKKLEILNLHSNKLEGNIQLYLFCNLLIRLLPREESSYSFLLCPIAGSIPSQLSNLTELQWLHLSNNSLMGSIPTTFGQFVNLEVFRLDSNKVEGNLQLYLSRNLLVCLLLISESSYLFVSMIQLQA